MLQCLASYLLLVSVGQTVASEDIPLVTFDGNKFTTFSFTELNDPVMGGQSAGAWAVDQAHHFGVFNGSVVDVPSLKAPGFIKAAADGTFPDVSQMIGGDLVLLVRTTTPSYQGFRISFASGTMSPSYACAGGGSLPLSRGCFKAKFSVPAGSDFTEIRVPFSAFSDKWSPATGDQTSTCTADKDVCPTARTLQKISRMELWAEGAKGDVHLDVKSVSASVGGKATAEETVEETVEENLPVSRFHFMEDSTCPPVTTQAGFDLDSYISSPWYIQQQAVTKYLPKEQNYCVSADYKRFDKSSFWGYTVQVHNHAEESDGTVHDSGDKICATVDTEAKDPAKLRVAPCFLPSFTSGPYWVLAYSEQEGYALVSGGQPTHQGPNGCTSNTDTTNNSGLWIFTRKQQRDDALLEKVRGLAKAQGFDLSVLNDVDQSKCK